MRPYRRCLGSLLVAALVLASVAAPAVAAGEATAGASTARTADAAAGTTQLGPAASVQPDRRLDNVTVTQVFRLTPSTPGEVVVTQYYTLPERIVSLNTSLPSAATVVDFDGFRYEASHTLRWDGSADMPSLTYRLPVNETLNGTATDGNASDLRAVDAGEWALFKRPNTPTEFTYRDPAVSFRQTGTADGPGAFGEWLVFLGEHEEYEREAHGQRFRLVVPAAANMTAPPERALDSMAAASDALRVGDRDETVFVVAAPAEGAPWGDVRGVQRGDADMWVRADRPVNDTENAWVHEYVHSRQQFELTADLQWFREATAVYYAALYTYEQDRVGFDAFRERLDQGASPRYNRTVLANRSSWNGTASYDRGALVAGRVDRQIRLASTYNRTLQTVVRAMNGDGERTTMTDFLELLGRAGDTSVIDSGQAYIETAADVNAWNRTAHEAAFSRPSPRVGYNLPELSAPGTAQVTGPYRTKDIDEGEPVVVVPGERLTLNALVTNAGGQAGNYTAQLTVNGTVVDRTNGTVAANGSTRAPLNHTFATPGRYLVGLDGDAVTVRVERTATARLVNFSVGRDAVQRGESVTVRAVVENNASVPGETTLVVSRNYEAVTSRQVRVGPAETTVVTFDVPLTSRGTAVLSVGGARPVEIAVTGPSNGTGTGAMPGGAENGTRNGSGSVTTGTGTSTVGDAGPGFGVVTGALALGALAALRRRAG